VILIEGEAYVVLGVNVLQDGESVTFKLWDMSNDKITDIQDVTVPGISGSDPYTFQNPLLLNAVSAPTGNLTITTAALPAGSVGAAYSQTLQATGGSAPYTWTVISGSLPPPLTLSLNGMVSGTPASATTGNLTVRVTDANNLSATVDLSLTITSPFATWQGQFTTADVSTGRTGLTADFDNDGMSNLLEYAFGKNPKAPNAAPVTVEVVGNQIQIFFPCDASCTDIAYTVQASPTLAEGSWTDIARSTAGATTVPLGTAPPLSTVSDSGTGLRTVIVTDTATLGNRRFLRVKVTVP